MMITMMAEQTETPLKSRTSLTIVSDIYNIVIMTSIFQSLFPEAATVSTIVHLSASTLSTTTPSFFVWIHKLLAPWLSILVFCAPIPTLYQISKDRTVGSLPLLPYTSMIASAFLWMTYGWLNEEPSIYVTNTVGMLLGMVYTYRFTRYAPSNSSTLPGSIQQHLLVLAGIMGTTLLLCFVLPITTSALWIGRAAVIFCLAMFASPLAALKTVLETQSAATIPLPFTLASCLNCWAWVVVGVWDMHDVNVYGTNGLALLFGLVQVALKIVYRQGGKGDKRSDASSSSGSLRLGLLSDMA
jgi:solute carrier family 50 (sugar transporter)